MRKIAGWFKDLWRRILIVKKALKDPEYMEHCMLSKDILDQRKVKWTINETAGAWAAAGYERQKPEEDQDVWSLTFNGFLASYKYKHEDHHQMFEWGNVFTSSQEANLKSHRVGQYLRSEIDLELQLSLITTEIFNIMTKEKPSEEDWLKLVKLSSLQD